MDLQTLQLQWVRSLLGIILHPWLFFLLLFFPLFFIFKFSRVSAKKTNLPPSPPKLPFLGNFHQLGSLPHHSFRSFSEKYGPLMLFQLGHVPTLVVSSSEIAKEVTATQDVVFANRPFLPLFKEIYFGGTDLAFSPFGDYWKQMRKICVHDLLSLTRVQSYKYIREEVVSIMLKKIFCACEEGTTINITDLLLAVSNNLICRVTLGRNFQGGENEKNNKLWRLTREVSALFGEFSVKDFFPLLGWMDTLNGFNGRLKRISKEMGVFLDQVVEDHLTKTSDSSLDTQKDFVDLLLRAQKDPTLSIPLTRADIKAIIVDMIVGGTDTTASTMEWAMAELVRNPNVMEKAQKEVRTAVGKKSKVAEDDISQLDYLNFIVKETLRLHPAAPLLVPRESSKATYIKGYYIPPKTRVFINAWAIQRDPKQWDDPEKFIPERFINSPVDFQGQHFQFLPFGAGRRGCPGMPFAVASFKFVLANLLYWFDWKLPGNAKVEEMDMVEANGTALYKKTPIDLLPKSYF
ncbi:cytochrome P450 71A1-like [Telopea speciosissima]|uniref:cytochrome P450 71A1-like n=1 Tax=Telopea speciosissima TaxID=54955 RepID=UPI001CC47202|nr:cytochrome P450 71A1-like [Telopea speciosissima]